MGKFFATLAPLPLGCGLALWLTVSHSPAQNPPAPMDHWQAEADRPEQLARQRLPDRQAHCPHCGREQAETFAPRAAEPQWEADADLIQLQEILRIRRRVGSPLRGTLLEVAEPDRGDVSGEDTFAGALRRLAGQAPDLGQPLEPPAPFEPPVPADSASGPTARCELAYQRQVAAESDRSSPLLESLLSTARLLDQQANQAEDGRQFELAGRHRRLAARLRQAARQLWNQGH